MNTRNGRKLEATKASETDTETVTRNGRATKGKAAERDRTRTDERRGPTCEISHDLRAPAGRRSSVTNFVSQLLADSFGLRPPLLNLRTLTCCKSARIA